AARRDEDGVLLLSKYTGAARELADAVQVNPFDIDAMTQALYGALTMEAAERRERMVRMRELVRTHNVYEWGIKIFTELQAIQPLVRAARRGGGA
ncbi:MAG: trehalose-6-phosphate synthase, partial [candidate division Zixibacteria bacterium]|nr:trehalose-6-phosphate synthase [candidate division Zixibacteria bacterium]